MSERQAHVDPSSPINCESCGETTVIAAERVGWVYCAACGEDFEVSREVWEKVYEHDCVYLEEQYELERAREEEARLKRKWVDWEEWCRQYRERGRTP